MLASIGKRTRVKRVKQTMAEQLCRWGILGTAGIARKHWRAVRSTSNTTIQAVASRSIESAQRFIDECQVDVPYPHPVAAVAPYEALLQRDDIDAVYIPLPTAMRHHWVIKAAEAGKHVLAEKPAAVDATQLKEMLHACKQHNVQYMDGVMFMHSARLPMIRRLLDDPKNVGKLRRMASQFSFCSNQEFRTQNIRVDSRLEPTAAWVTWVGIVSVCFCGFCKAKCPFPYELVCCRPCTARGVPWPCPVSSAPS